MTTRRPGPRIVLAALAAGVAVIGLLPAGGASAAPYGAFNPRMAAGPFVPVRGSALAVVNTKGDLDYNGGPVMPSNTDYAIFWSPSGFGAYGPGATPEYVTGLDQYFTDLAHDSGGHQNVDSVAAQYNDLTGHVASYKVTFGGGILDTDPYPPSQCPVNAPVTNCLTDLQMQKELEHVAAIHHFKRDLSHEYFLLTPPHVENCGSSDPSTGFGGCSAGEVPSSLAVYCAYHSNSTVNPPLIYAIDPYVTGNPGCDDGKHPNGPSDGALQGGLSHEHNESISDPVPNDAWTDGAGPDTGRTTLHGFEVGDLCEGSNGTPLGTAPDGSPYNQVINGHFYWYQEEWSNAGQACLQRLGTVARPTAKFTVKPVGPGRTLSFDASGSSASSGIAAYVWQFNDAFGAPVVITRTPSVTHTFPVDGAYSVGLTVFTANGTSAGTGGIVQTGHAGVTPGFSFSPSAPTAGHAVSFSAIGTVSRKPVLTWMWEFGDGSTGFGQHPKHTYSRSGTYTVTLVMFSGEGSAWPSDGAGPISTQRIKVG
jgi:PKD repeat protein